ncbi:hypothetical protein P22_2361 [Propionispora sp. 2/2-37]|uniref:flagellar filament capping protein FliD n=1 Tax=Propionispora sp. 2/2-37 TaxID=1677858 RepID=UPI0006BB63F1|nr:flagellar filament capping protein FliD [Propionispora sp. 2/2-37]CUH96271.1 hypothetical protein P22_2361 [Propionispora sp. 2/2-37]
MSGISTVNGTTRYTGLASGLDVDSIVESLMTAEKTKLNSLNQDLQLAEWKQEAYQDIIDDITEFYDTYFSTTSSSSLMLQSSFLKFDVSSDSSAVTATYTSSASAGTHTVTVSQLATAATLSNSTNISKEVQGSSSADYSSLSGTSFVITVDDATRTVSLDNVSDLDSLQEAIDAAVGEGKVVVSEDDDGVLSITAADDSGVQEIAISAPSSGTSALSKLGFGSDANLSNRLTISTKLSALADQFSNGTLTFNSLGQIELTINGTTLQFDSDDTLSEMISKVNSSDCGATMKYDEVSGKLTLTANDTGAGNTLTVTESDGSNFLEAAFGITGSTATASGKDAIVTVDGVKLTRSSNTFTVDGVKYTVTAETSEKANITVTQDSQAIYDLISNFVDAYNDLIDTINSALDEDYDSDYAPLTDDQKEEMTDDEIEQWESKAKTGLLENDSTLKSLVRNLRQSLTDSVSGISTSIFGIGISSGSYDEKGKLYIDEDTLMDAIESDPEAIMNLFTQKSETYGSTSDARNLTSKQQSVRYSEEGLAWRFYDILTKNVATKVDSSGDKGLLIELAGTDDDSSATDNTYYTKISKLEDEIADEEDRLDDYEDSLYTKYTNLETYLEEMNQQLATLQSLLGSD